MTETHEGTVIRVEGASCLVRLDGSSRTERCEMRRGLRWTSNEAQEAAPSRLAAGDRVVLGGVPPAPLVIEAVGPRRTKLARRAAGEKASREQVVAANVDRLAIIASVRDPEWKPGFVDRLLIAAEKGGLEPFVVMNKIDLLDEDARAATERDLDIYRVLGIPAIATSTRRGDGIDALGLALRGRTTVLSGPSGVGKSSLLNAIEPGLRLVTGEVSESTGKGRHTTTSISLLPLAIGGFVLDTPGVREFGFYDVTRQELRGLFREFPPVARGCRYPDCSHTHEPECAVRDAIARGKISPRRHESYLRILESLET